MTQFYAQPYDISANGFYFDTYEEYTAKAAKNRNDFGGIVEEYELQFIDGESVDCELFNALNISQCNIADFIEKLEEWEDWEKDALIIAVRECGYDFDIANGDPSDFDLEICHVESMRELAEEQVEQGLFGDIPESIRFYLDYDAIARDLSMDYGETCIAGCTIIYRCN